MRTIVLGLLLFFSFPIIAKTFEVACSKDKQESPLKYTYSSDSDLRYLIDKSFFGFIKKNDTQSVSCLLMYDKTLVYARDASDHDNTGLHKSVLKNDYTMITLLLIYGADVNSPNSNNESPMSLIFKLKKVDKNQLALIEIMIQSYNGDINYRYKNGLSLIERALKEINVELVVLYIKNGGSIFDLNSFKENIFHYFAAYAWPVKNIQEVVTNTKITYSDVENIDGFTPLEYAIDAYDAEIVEFYLKNNANPYHVFRYEGGIVTIAERVLEKDTKDLIDLFAPYFQSFSIELDNANRDPAVLYAYKNEKLYSFILLTLMDVDLNQKNILGESVCSLYLKDKIKEEPKNLITLVSLSDEIIVPFQFKSSDRNELLYKLSSCR